MREDLSEPEVHMLPKINYSQGIKINSPILGGEMNIKFSKSNLGRVRLLRVCIISNLRIIL